jgi:cell pole-organizing protein PopZ
LQAILGQFDPQGQGFVDIKVGDILANIRKSVDDDMDSLALPSTASQARGTLMRGVLREMRVTMTSEPPANFSAREEIETLRDRIKRKGEAASLLAGTVAQTFDTAAEISKTKALSQKATSARGDFSGILAGATPEKARAPSLRAELAPALRPSLAEEDHFSGDYQDDEPQPTRAYHQQPQWAEDDQAYGDEFAEQPYAEPQHYHDRAAQEQAYGAEPTYPMVSQQPLLSNHAEAATEAAFRHLSESLLARATGDRGLEDMTREMLRGLIKQWLDANLPTLVEELVREEIERVARRGR